MASKELQALLQVLRSQPAQADLSIEERRSAMEAAFSQFPLAEDVRCEPVDAGGVPAEWIVTPQSVQERVICYLHGGGYVLGSIKTHREMASRLSRGARARVLLID